MIVYQKKKLKHDIRVLFVDPSKVVQGGVIASLRVGFDSRWTAKNHLKGAC